MGTSSDPAGRPIRRLAAGAADGRREATVDGRGDDPNSARGTDWTDGLETSIGPSQSAGDQPGTVVIVEEPPPPRRIRQPIDLARLVLAVAGLAVVALVAGFAVRTTGGLESDIGAGSSDVPSWIINSLTLLVAIALFALPVVVLLDQVLRGRQAWIADLVIAGLAGAGVAVGVSWLLRNYGPADIYQSLTVERTAGGRTAPILTFPCALAALTSTAVHGDRRWVRIAIWVTFGGLAVTALLDRQAGVLAVVSTLLIGRAIGLTVRYALGTPNTRLHGGELVGALREAGLDPLRVQSQPSLDQVRRYLVTSGPTPQLDATRPPANSGPTRTDAAVDLDVRVFDRDQEAADILGRLWRRVRLRSPVARRATVTLRSSVEHNVLMAQAAAAARVRTPRLVVAAAAGPDAALLAYQHAAGLTLDRLADGEIDDALLRDIYAQLAAARAHHLTVRGLNARQILVDDRRQSWLTGVGAGEIAATGLQLRLDAAQLLTTLALLVGPQRAAATAIDTLGPEAATSAVPLLQSIAMNSATRTALRSHRTLLAELRDAVLQRVPAADIEPVRIERLRPRNILTVLGGAFAAYYLLSQLGQVNLGELVTSADPGWSTLTVAFALLSFAGAAMAVMGFVPIRLPVVRTFLAQVAASFVKLVAPVAVGPVALNTRYVQRAGLEPALALASVGLSQVFGFVLSIGLLVLFGVITGTSTNADSRLVPSQTVFIVAAAAAVVILVALSIPWIRRRALRRIQPMVRRVVPRLLDMLQSPAKLLLGVGGNIVVTLSFMAALYTSVLAFGGSISFASLGVVFLAGSAVGSAAPTPGGIGAVEAALSAGLTAAGLPGQIAVSAVLLFRAVTFWLPVVPGWLAFQTLQRAGAL